MPRAISRVEKVGWALAGLVLIGFAIPWFLWDVGGAAYGLPVWVWWHVGWMVVASLTFYAFAHRAWGIGVEGIHRG